MGSGVTGLDDDPDRFDRREAIHRGVQQIQGIQDSIAAQKNDSECNKIHVRTMMDVTHDGIRQHMRHSRRIRHDIDVVSH